MQYIRSPFTRQKESYFAHYSSKKMITVFVLVFIFPLIILQIATSAFALNTYRHQTSQTLEQMASYFLSETDESLNSIEHYLAKTASENYEFQRIAYDDPQSQINTEYELFKTRFYLSMRQDVSFYPAAQYFFFYHEYRDDLLLIPSVDYMPNTTTLAYPVMSKYLSGYFDTMTDPQRKWVLVNISGQEHLLKTFHFGNAYLGASVPIDILLEKLKKYNLTECIFQISDSVQNDATEPNQSFPFHNNRIVLNSALGDYVLSLTINQKDFFTPSLIVWCSFLLLSVLMLYLIPLSSRVLKEQFYTPLEILVKHMHHIENDETTERLPEKLGGVEMTQVAKSFNQMMDQINHLKIEVYEKKLAQSQLELQCLHLQLNPHFFLNTLNSAYLLVRTGDLDKLQLLLKSLTGYFRSIFRPNSETTVLSQELEQCRNYIYIYQLRCFKEIHLDCDIDQSLMNQPIPPMCILTFIENAIKYAVEDLNELHLTLSIHEETADSRTDMNIIIYDNGCGFSNDTLNTLNTDFVAQTLTGSHIGIRNLQQRLHYFYKGTASIIFDNTIYGGARITMKLPLYDSKI